MISVQRINGKEFIINADFIETVEETPDTVIKLTSGKVFMVLDTPESIIEKCISYKNKCGSRLTVKRQTGEEIQ
jgi:flagellar protein FlbD